MEASPKVSAFLDDIPAVIRCVPHVERVREIHPGLYEGSARIKSGSSSSKLRDRSMSNGDQMAPGSSLVRAEISVAALLAGAASRRS